MCFTLRFSEKHRYGFIPCMIGSLDMPAPLISEKAERALRDIGLTEYETLAYMSLLRSGEMTAESVSEASNIPYTKVYSVLDSLHGRGWVEVEGGSPRRDHPRSPADALTKERSSFEETFERNMRIIVDELQPLFEKKDNREVPEIWIIRGEDNSFKKIIELVGKAEREIMLAIPRVPEKIDPSFRSLLKNTIRKFIDKDLRIKVLTTRQTLAAIDSPEIHIAEIRVCDTMFGGGLVVDGRDSLIFLDLRQPSGPDTSLWSEHETISTIAAIYFQHMWNNSEPVS